MKNIHKAKLIRLADKYMVRVWDSEQPKLNDYSPTSSGKEFYDHDMRNWNKSYKEYEVHPDYVDRFKELKQGIDLAPDLIEVVPFYHHTSIGSKTSCYAILKDKPVEIECDHYYPMSDSWELLPCEFCGKSKVESEDVYDLADTIRLSYLKNGNDSWVSIAKDVKEKYTLKRK